jgi:hypothetical protein
MNDFTESVLKLRAKRQESFKNFVDGIEPALTELADFIGVENPQTAVKNPEMFLKVLDLYFKEENFRDLDLDAIKTLHLMLTYFIGQFLVFRHRGDWFLNEERDSKSFLRYVVGKFEDSSIRENIYVDPFDSAQKYLEKLPGRS